MCTFINSFPILNPFPCIISVVTIGFDPATYTVNESAGNVSVTVNVLNGILDRDMYVRLVTSLSDGTATGIHVYIRSS